MRQMGSSGKVTLVLTLAVASLLLAVFLTENRAHSHNLESTAALSAQLGLFRQQLAGGGQIEQSQEGGHGEHANHGSQNSPATNALMPGMQSPGAGMNMQLLDTQLGQLAALQEQQRVTLDQGRRLVLVTAVISCVLVALLMWLFLRQQWLNPLAQLASVARRLQDNDTQVHIPQANKASELGALAQALESFRTACLSASISQPSTEPDEAESEQTTQEQMQREQDRERMQARQLELEDALAQARQSLAGETALQQRLQHLSETVGASSSGNLNGLVKRLEEEPRSEDPLGRTVSHLGKLLAQFDGDFVSINIGAGQLVESAAHLQGLGESISDSAIANKERTKNLMAGAEGVRDVLLQVSSNVEQMESGIQGISDNASQASVVATQAVELAQSTDGTMRKLADSSVDINNVIKLITSIAEQTNLLALNATIEAARAGDAGKGFAVVANEVKELAKETNKATDEIQRRITAIRTETGHAVEAIGNINQIVSQIDGLQGNISESVLDQTSAVKAILALIGNASEDNLMVREVLLEVLERQTTTQASAEEVQRSSEVLRTGAEGNLQITRRYAH